MAVAAVSDSLPASEASEDFLPLASDFQKTLVRTGHWINEFPRKTARQVIQLIYSPVPAENALWNGALKIQTFFMVCLSLALMLISAPFYLAALCAGPGRFEQFDPSPSAPPLPLPEKTVHIAFINFCAQDPWSILSGGQPTAQEPGLDGQTRMDKLVARLLEKKPHLICGQEFDDLGVMEEISRRLTLNGYSCFGDLGCHTLFNHSGLFMAASPEVIKSIAFRRFHPDHVSGVTSWCDRGILKVTVALQNGLLDIFTFHLNSGDKPKHATSRLLQFRHYVAPFLKGKRALGVGDANFDTSKLSDLEKKEADFVGLTNELEGQITCSDEGKHILLGKDRNGCIDCEEKIDVVLHDPAQVYVDPPEMEKGYSDHNLIFVTASLAENFRSFYEAESCSDRANLKSSL